MGKCCGGDKESKSSQTQTTTTPLRQNYASLVSRGEEIANQPYQAYGGPRVANFNADQQQAFQNVRDGNGMNEAYNYASLGAAPVTTQQVLDQYNPYIDAQVNQYQQDAAYRQQIGDQQLNSQIAQQGALTGDRGFVARQLAHDSQNRIDSGNVANIRSQGFNEATRIAEGNRDASRLAGTQFASLSGEDLQRLMGIGSIEQQLDQAQYDVNYQDYLDKESDPFRRAQWLSGIYGSALPGMGSTTTGTSTATQPGPSLLSQAVGLGTAGMGLWKLSDERTKTDIKEIGTTHDGLPIYSFKGLDQPGTQIGLMAQDVEQRDPGAVADVGGGLKAVNYDRATAPAAHMKNGGHAGNVAAWFEGMGNPMLPMPSFDNLQPVNRFDFAPSAPETHPDFASGVNPELARIVGQIGEAVKGIRGHMNGGKVEEKAAGGPAGIRPMPSRSYVPEIPLTPPQMSPMPSLAMSTVGSSGGDLGSQLGGFGRMAASLAKPYGANLGGDMGLHDWGSGTSVMGFADGGDVPKNPYIHPFYSRPDDDEEDSGVPGLSLARTPDFSRSVVPEISLQPPSESFQSAPTFSMQSASEMLPSVTEAPAVAGFSATEPKSGNEKSAWYEYGSDPNVGYGLLSAGLGMLGGDSPHAGVNIGRGGLQGVETYMNILSGERAERQKQKAAETQADRLAQEAARFNRTQSEVERHNLAAEGGDGKNKPIEVKGRLVQKQDDGTYKEVYTSPGAEGGKQNWNSTKDRAGAEEGLRKEYTSLAKPFFDVRDSYGRILQSAKDPSPAGDLALIFNYMKMLDPGSTVRETEFANAENAASVPEVVRNKWNKFLEGTRLGSIDPNEASSMRADFVTQARGLYGSQKDQYDKIHDQYKSIAERLDLDSQNVFIDHSRVDDAAFQDARDAISKGADPEAVRKELQAKGYNPAGL